MNTWTKFADRHSGGSRKLDVDVIYIQAEENEAVELFRERFQHNPDNETCSCCGPDFSYWEVDDLNESIQFDKDWGSEVLIIDGKE